LADDVRGLKEKVGAGKLAREALPKLAYIAGRRVMAGLERDQDFRV
jgi:hypothetical protein